jgi:hypothetical protein
MIFTTYPILDSFSTNGETCDRLKLKVNAWMSTEEADYEIEELFNETTNSLIDITNLTNEQQSELDSFIKNELKERREDIRDEAMRGAPW